VFDPSDCPPVGQLRKLTCAGQPWADGEPRSTADVDIVAAIEDSHVPALASGLSTDFYVDEDALRRAVRERSSVNLIHQATQLKIDVAPFSSSTTGRSRECAAAHTVEALSGERPATMSVCVQYGTDKATCDAQS